MSTPSCPLCHDGQNLASNHRCACGRQGELVPAPCSELLQREWERGYVRAVANLPLSHGSGIEDVVARDVLRAAGSIDPKNIGDEDKAILSKFHIKF